MRSITATFLASPVNFGGGPVGIDTIAASLSEPRDAIEEIIEPYLIQQGFVNRTPRGRVAYRARFQASGTRRSATARDIAGVASAR